MFSSFPKNAPWAMMWTLLIFVSNTAVMAQRSEGLTPKMVAHLVPDDETGRHRLLSTTDTSHTETAFGSVYLQDCVPGQDVTFDISAGDSRGYVGLMDNTDAAIALQVSAGSVELDADKVPGVFAAIAGGETDDGTMAQPFVTTEVPDDGATGTIQCTEAVTLLIALKDQSGLELAYDVETTETGGGAVTLTNEEATEDVTAQAYDQESVSPNTRGRRNLKPSNKVQFKGQTKKGFQYESSQPGEVIVAQVKLSQNGKTVYRSLVTHTQPPPPPVVPMKLHKARVNNDGDLDLHFTNIPLEHVLLQAVVGVELKDGSLLEQDKVHVKTFVDDGHLVIHGGWIRRALDKQADIAPGSTKGWKIVVLEATASDGDNNYLPVAALPKAEDTAVVQNKELLSSAVDEIEKGISLDMAQGRPPATDNNNRHLRSGQETEEARKLSGPVEKILVHGYCAESNPWTSSAFTNPKHLFRDEDAPGSPSSRRQLGGSSGLNNWSNDLFARKIRHYANYKGLSYGSGNSCSIIAHSQGGLAALHLYSYYYSCLDNGPSRRLIQSVGSPYQGTALAGSLASLGSVFGVGCDSQNDLTESGAVTWLSYIPTWARNAVYYYTTSFKDRWWAYDYCNFATDPFLSDPDDGVVAKGRGQLPSGNNAGHKTNQCHTTGMRDDAQYLDGNRNSQMNAYAV